MDEKNCEMPQAQYFYERIYGMDWDKSQSWLPRWGWVCLMFGMWQYRVRLRPIYWVTTTQKADIFPFPPLVVGIVSGAKDTHTRKSEIPRLMYY